MHLFKQTIWTPLRKVMLRVAFGQMELITIEAKVMRKCFTIVKPEKDGA